MTNKRKLDKFSGIYQITNIINGKVYIGMSNNITLRWYFHMDNLLKNIHHNHKLQEDYNKYGLSAFNFSTLEIVEGKDNLIKKEKEYINNINLKENYNCFNPLSYIDNERDIESFINYIKSKWLMSKNIETKEKDKYKIYKQEDKNEIIDMSIKYNILKEYPSHITFTKVLKFMTNHLGFTIISDKKTINKKLRKIKVYKIIINFDKSKINEEWFCK